jgi:hypothetical protein
MQVDHNPFLINTLELNNPKVLIRPDQAEKAKGKNVIIGEQRPREKVQNKLLDDTPKVSAKASTLGGQAKTKKTGNTSTSLTGAPNRSDRCPLRCRKDKNKVKLTFEELLAKYKRKEQAKSKGVDQVKVKIRKFQQKSKYTLFLQISRKLCCSTLFICWTDLIMVLAISLLLFTFGLC